ncbi:MAG TPA: SsrA-binding protein SmpB [Alphaproteobacteria bacterium]|nr:SsrA-binding protein SmpB [Alphaproteobacteria bacterium]
MSTKATDNYKVIAVNKRARFDYFIEDTVEAGIILTGSEVKSLRMGKASIAESHAAEMSDNGKPSLYLLNANIKEYSQASHFNHSPTRPRKLLLRGSELNKLLGSIRKKGMTVVPIQLYFNHKGLVKLTIGLGQGKKLHDKRETSKERDWKRDKARILRNNNR